MAATGIAQSVLDEIQTRSFDEFTITKPTTSIDSLTSAYMLGPESGEAGPTQFDDVDDFKGYSDNNSTTRLGNYSIAVDVGYVTFANPSAFTNTRTFTKRINIKVYGQYMSDTLSMSHIIAY
jgi:MSHA pilin protein MshD